MSKPIRTIAEAITALHLCYDAEDAGVILTNCVGPALCILAPAARLARRIGDMSSSDTVDAIIAAVQADTRVPWSDVLNLHEALHGRGPTQDWEFWSALKAGGLEPGHYEHDAELEDDEWEEFEACWREDVSLCYVEAA